MQAGIPSSARLEAARRPAAKRGQDKSSLVSRNVTVGAYRTSVRLEPDMWNGLREICRREHVSLHDIATAVAQRQRSTTSMTAALRVFIMAYYPAAATEGGHARAGHGSGGPFMPGLVREAPVPKMVAGAPSMRSFEKALSLRLVRGGE